MSIYLLGIDIGTSACKIALLTGKPVLSSAKTIKAIRSITLGRAGASRIGGMVVSCLQGH